MLTAWKRPVEVDPYVHIELNVHMMSSVPAAA